jgi:hypothetical protein
MDFNGVERFRADAERRVQSKLAKPGDAVVTPAQPLYTKIVANERLSRTSNVLRDTLLPKLLSGELRVKDTETIISAIV